MTNLITTDEAPLKKDERGRVQTPASRRESLLDEFDRSGLSAAKFAALAGIKYATFAAWSLRRRRQRGEAPTATPNADSVRWLEAVVAAAPSPGHPSVPGVLVRLPGGVCVEVAQVQQVPLAAALIQALGRPC
ncbi:MAG: hypothetical protein WAN35_19125 [Terracidiphilus sp.]